MRQLVQDVRYALRQLRKSPGFTATAIITLALGIGANTAAFTLMHGILLRSLPVTDPGQLYRIGDTNIFCCESTSFPTVEGDFSIFSYDLYLHFKKAAPEFEQLAAVPASSDSYSVRSGNTPAQSLTGEFVSGNYFATLNVGAHLGRVISEVDDVATASPVIVLSYDAWKGQFAGNPAIVGSKVMIQTHPFTVIGIAERGFYGDRVTENAPAFWMPLATERLIGSTGTRLQDPDTHWLYTIGRLRRGVRVDLLQTRLSAVLRQWLISRPANATQERKAGVARQQVRIVPARTGIQQMTEVYGEGLRNLLLLSSIVLLIACANIANLLQARGIAHRADASIRMALGATRGRLIRQILIESLLLSSIGGIVGLAVAYLGSYLILAFTFPDSINLPIQAAPSLPVLTFTFVVTLICGLLFGTAPARLSSNIQPAEVLRGQNHSTRGISAIPQKILVVFQAALSLVLLVGAILTARSLYNLGHQNFGFAASHRFILHLDIDGAGYTSKMRPALYDKITKQFASLHGVTGVGLAGYSFLEGYNWFDCIVEEGQPLPKDLNGCYSSVDAVSPHYLDLIEVPMILGRELTEQDTPTSTPVAVINQTFANRYYPNQNPIGKRFRSYDGSKASEYRQVIGVFQDVKTFHPDSGPQPMYLGSLIQRPDGGATLINSILIRFDHEPANVDQLLRFTLGRVDPNLTVVDLRSYESQISSILNHQRLMAQLSVVFGVLATILASVGLYGVTSYIVLQRTSEIGIRMALGSTRFGVILLVLRGAAWQIGIGLAVGIPCALTVARLIQSQLYELKWYDPSPLIGAALILSLCAVAAALIPAYRAASIQPMQALRTE